MDSNGDDDEMWEWQEGDYSLPKNSNTEISQCLWDGISPNEKNLTYMFDEATPIKDCGDLASSNNENTSKESHQRKETLLQSKRRRILQFDTEVRDAPPCIEEASCSFLKEMEDDSVKEALSGVSQWVSGFTEDPSGLGYGSLDQSTEDGWISNCFSSDVEMNFGLEEMNPSESSDVQIITEFCNTPNEYEDVSVVQPQRTRNHPNIVFKGRKSYMRTPAKLASSVAYPFTFVKPCGVHGDVTLKEINQRIRTPPPSKPKHTNEDPSASYPTSAFSGKPVVGKTKIRTEGGKGSITIMRTKG